jgi:Zn-dependent M28 family amino/carboxypeptidase
VSMRWKPSSKPRPRALAGVAVAALVGASLTVSSPVAEAKAATSCNHQNNNTYAKLLACVTVQGVRAHQAALQRIADANDDPFYPGTRAAGTEGYANSVAYVAGRLEAAGYDVTLDPFDFEFNFPVELDQLTPVNASYDSGSFANSGSGELSGPVIPVDINLEPPRPSTSGCEAADFAGLDFTGPSDIALIQRGTCTFAIKALNAVAAGAEAVIIFNQGNDPTREGLIIGTLAPDSVSIPVVGASFARRRRTCSAGIDRAHQRPAVVVRTDYNVIAERHGVNDNNVVMAGAHLDSVVAGPGINDDGSGTSALLEIALKMAKVEPQNTLRFAWWGDEEGGLVGSTAYVDGLSPEERDRIGLYLNFDMVGSPNYIFMTFDADQSSFEAPVPVPDGSTAIEDLFESLYTRASEPYDDTEFNGRSDYQAFIEAGIPAGGLFTGAEQVKTAEQEAIWGGTVGAQFDPCYHLACDAFPNVNLHALDVNSDLIAFALLTYAYSTESVNGVPGVPVPGTAVVLPEPAGPEGTFVPNGGRAADSSTTS